MKTIRNINGVETKIYAETFEQEAYNQIYELCDFLPYVDSRIRIMPDAHAGKGCTVGTTMTIADKITPNLIGVDIGCGMNVLKLYDVEIDLAKLDHVIHEFIPSGFDVHSSPLVDYDFSDLICRDSINLQRAALSIGTLGGGNHFIEVNRSKTGGLYLVIHSGSRNLGKCVCEHYQKIAQSLNPGVNKDLAYLYGSDMEDYLHDMDFAQEYAVMNRRVMAAEIQKNMGFQVDYSFESIHNYIDFNRMILRKGAVSAESGQKLIIPINMRDGSLICIGKGNEDWNYSAPHGAGRLMSRSKAKKMLSLSEFSDSMDGVYTTSVCTETLDEAPMAYKPMDEIIRCVSDTVEIVDIIKPIYNFKAH
jgi:RNA-splicing ligase RtcB